MGDKSAREPGKEHRRQQNAAPQVLQAKGPRNPSHEEILAAQVKMGMMYQDKINFSDFLKKWYSDAVATGYSNAALIDCLEASVVPILKRVTDPCITYPDLGSYICQLKNADTQLQSDLGEDYYFSDSLINFLPHPW